MKVKMNAPATVCISALCVITFILSTLTGGFVNSLLFSVYRSSLLSPLTWLRFFTHVYGHASLSHIAGNLTLFLLVGPIVEERFGTVKYLVLINITAVIIGLAQFVLFPSTGLLGLSGVVFMLIVLSAYGSSPNGTKEIPVTVILVIILWVGKEAANALFQLDDISQFSHLLGGVCGFVFGLKRD